MKPKQPQLPLRRVANGYGYVLSPLQVPGRNWVRDTRPWVVKPEQKAA